MKNEQNVRRAVNALHAVAEEIPGTPTAKNIGLMADRLMCEQNTVSGIRELLHSAATSFLSYYATLTADERAAIVLAYEALKECGD